jgi:Plasmid pRiA4b ORF-3-like protein
LVRGLLAAEVIKALTRRRPGFAGRPASTAGGGATDRIATCARAARRTPDSLDRVTELPPIPTDPAALQEWVNNLSPEDLTAITQKLTSGGLLQPPQPEVDDLFWTNTVIDVPAPPDEPTALTLTIELRGSKPRIWRRLVLPGDLTLDAVHAQFQAAMGWTDSHLHRFQPGAGQGHEQVYFITEFDEEEGDEGTLETTVRLDQVLRAPGDRMVYLYDFGDGWEHLVKLESVKPVSGEPVEPLCIGGAGACPPEDVGGIWGFLEVAAWLRAGAPVDAVPEPFETAEHALGWLPVDYHPDAFDQNEASAAMRLWASGKHLPWHSLPEQLVELIQGVRWQGWNQLTDWLAALGPRVPVDLDEADVVCGARPWTVVLSAIGPELRLTPAGYLPPVVVAKIAQDVGLDMSLVGNATREEQVWPVAGLRDTTVKVGLLRKVKGTLTPTARARAVVDDPRALVETVLRRLPLGKGFPAEAGWFAIVGLAAGVPAVDLDAGVAQMLTGRGWRTRDR